MHLRRECDEKLLQVEFGILRKRDLNPQRWLEVVHVHIKGRMGVVFRPKVILGLREPVVESGAIVTAENRSFILRSTLPHCYIHFS